MLFVSVTSILLETILKLFVAVISLSDYNTQSFLLIETVTSPGKRVVVGSIPTLSVWAGSSVVEH